MRDGPSRARTLERGCFTCAASRRNPSCRPGKGEGKGGQPGSPRGVSGLDRRAESSSSQEVTSTAATFVPRPQVCGGPRRFWGGAGAGPWVAQSRVVRSGEALVHLSDRPRRDAEAGRACLWQGEAVGGSGAALGGARPSWRVHSCAVVVKISDCPPPPSPPPAPPPIAHDCPLSRPRLPLARVGAELAGLRSFVVYDVSDDESGKENAGRSPHKDPRSPPIPSGPAAPNSWVSPCFRIEAGALIQSHLYLNSSFPLALQSRVA